MSETNKTTIAADWCEKKLPELARFNKAFIKRKGKGFAPVTSKALYTSSLLGVVRNTKVQVFGTESPFIRTQYQPKDSNSALSFS